MDMRYVEVKEVKELFDQLHSWNKEQFLWDIGAARFLSANEMREIIDRH